MTDKWSGSGHVEPPAGVDLVQDKNGWQLQRFEGNWRGVEGQSGLYHHEVLLPWNYGMPELDGPWTEV